MFRSTSNIIRNTNTFGFRNLATYTTTKTKSKAPVSIAVAAAAAGAIGLTYMDVTSAKEQNVDIKKIKEELGDYIDENNAMGNTFIRLAWHSCGSYDKKTGTGGSRNGTIRFKQELAHGGNAGLWKAVEELQPFVKAHPEISEADLIILAGITALEEFGGPEIPFRLGRVDGGEELVPAEGNLPDADKGTKPKTIQHVRDVFYRMGFNDREIVALIGAHALGRCYTSRSGYSGPWTNAEWTFSNEYFRLLVEEKWTIKQWDGPEQYEDSSKQLMMLPADMALIWDPEFAKYVKMYAKDEELFFKDFAAAFTKLTELGVKFPREKWFGIF